MIEDYFKKDYSNSIYHLRAQMNKDDAY